MARIVVDPLVQTSSTNSVAVKEDSSKLSVKPAPGIMEGEIIEPKNERTSISIEMFNLAQEAEQNGDLKQATHLCIQFLKQNADIGASAIAECSGMLARIFHKNGQFEEALRYSQLEKAIYETSILALSGPLSNGEREESEADALEGEVSDEKEMILNPPSLSMESDEKRARSFELLAEMLFENGQTEMSKVYALRAIRMRRRNDPNTVEYVAEVGRKQYQEALREYTGQSPSIIEDLFHDDIISEVDYLPESLPDAIENKFTDDARKKTTASPAFRSLLIQMGIFLLFVLMCFFYILSPYPRSMWSRILFGGKIQRS